MLVRRRPAGGNNGGIILLFCADNSNLHRQQTRPTGGQTSEIQLRVAKLAKNTTTIMKLFLSALRNPQQAELI